MMPVAKKINVAIKTFFCKLTIKWGKCKRTKKKLEELNKQWSDDVFSYAKLDGDKEMEQN